MKRLARLAAIIAAYKKQIAAVAAFVSLEVFLIIWIFHPASGAGIYLKSLVGYFLTTTFSIGWGFWLEYYQTSLDGLAEVFKVALRAYLELKEENKQQIAEKVGKTAVKWLAYWLSDWGVEIGMVTMIGTLKYHNFAWNEILAISWVVDVLVALTFIFISKNFIDDFMLMVAYRRAFDTLYSISKQAGSLFLGYSLVKFSFWDGSEVATMFFEKELNTTAKKVLAVMFFSSLRILLLVKVVKTGYNFLN